MKTVHIHFYARKAPAALALLSVFCSPPLSNGLAQGSLTPPGPPGPTLKTLAQVEPRTPISALPYIISNSGSYYLTDTLTGIAGTNGIMISANEVTLDLNGFGLVGVPGSLDGIGTTGVFVFQTNVTIMNGALRNWGGNGINLKFFYNTVFRDLLLETNGAAGLNAGTFSTIRNCMANRNGNIGFNAGTFALVSGCMAAYNAGEGFFGGEMSIENCGAYWNTEGLYLYSASIARNCQVLTSNFDCIELGQYCCAIGNTCSRQGTAPNGFCINVSMDGGRIDGNHLQYSSGRAVNVPVGSTNWVIIRNTTYGPKASAFFIPAGNDLGPVGSAATNTSPWGNISN